MLPVVRRLYGRNFEHHYERSRVTVLIGERARLFLESLEEKINGTRVVLLGCETLCVLVYGHNYDIVVLDRSIEEVEKSLKALKLQYKIGNKHVEV